MEEAEFLFLWRYDGDNMNAKKGSLGEEYYWLISRSFFLLSGPRGPLRASECTPQLQWQEVVASREACRRITFTDMETGLQHDMASREALSVCLDQISLVSLFFHMQSIGTFTSRASFISGWVGVRKEGGTPTADTLNSSLSLFTQRHFSGYVVTRGEGGRVRVRTCSFWNAFPTHEQWSIDKILARSPQRLGCCSSLEMGLCLYLPSTLCCR